MLSIHDLLEDSEYKQFLCQIPSLPDHLTAPGKEPWRLLVQLKGDPRWKTKRFETYPQMFKAFKRLRPRIHDAALNSPAVFFHPPQEVVEIRGKYFVNKRGKRLPVTKLVVWSPTLPPGEYEAHNWCGYCRRPTVFKAFQVHHALPQRKLGGIPIDPTLRRCSICGASENIVPLRKS